MGKHDDMNEKIGAEQSAFERAVRAAQNGLAGKPLTLDTKEQEMLATFPEQDRLAVIVFVRWCEGQKWEGGIVAKRAGKAAFIQAFRIARAIWGPKDDNDMYDGIELPRSGAQ